MVAGRMLEERVMGWLSRADVVLLLIAGYIAIMSLVRMMLRRHDELVADVKRQVEAHRKRPKRPKTAEAKPGEKKSPDQTRGAA
jgi:hypothetical protein